MNLRFLLLAGLFLTPCAFADTPLYQVEILIFSQPAEEVPEEAVSHDAQDSMPGGVIDFGRSICMRADADPQMPPTLQLREDVQDCLLGYLRLNELLLPMTEDRLLLTRSGSFRVLYHGAWQQPAPPLKRSQFIRIDALPSAVNSAIREGLTGSARLFKEQFLQLEFLLQYRPAGAAPEDKPISLRLSQRLRSGDSNYIDHPQIGILARVTEVLEKETEEESPEGAEEQAIP